ncbi:MAG: 30S ribosomal protein S3 [Deltaproteobacteria bacterium]|nr:MAG: 30S ribosomal protein S3 [Deltaproteobacteria bacterium]
MGQKVHPNGFRLGINRTWFSRWYSESGYADILGEDIFIRKEILRRYKMAGVGSVHIERSINRCCVEIQTLKPGLIIGKKGAGIDSLRRRIQKNIKTELMIHISEIKRPEIEAQLVAENVAQQIQRRIAYRKAMKRGINNALRVGVKGIKIEVSGRLGGADIARSEWYREGRVPLHTIRANIDYGFAESMTTYGVIGCKVWIFKGEVLNSSKPESKGEVGHVNTSKNEV